MSFTEVLEGLLHTAKDIIPVTSFLIIFQLFVLKTPIDNLKTKIFGLVLCTIGLYLFVEGLKIGLIPLGNSAGSSLTALDNKLIIIGFAFVLGYTTTLAEPTLASMAMEIEEISTGAMANRVFVHTVALGVAFGTSLGILKILFKIPSSYIIIPLAILTAVLAYFAPESIVGIAFDTAGVTTGPVTVPLNMAIAIGLSSMIEGSDPLIDGFGLIALIALTPVITVMSLGIITKF